MEIALLLALAAAVLAAALAGRRLVYRRKGRALRRLAQPGPLLMAAAVKGFHYVEGNEAILPLLREGESLLLRREPENIHDCNAVRLLRQDGQPIGYLPMADNSIPAALLDQGIPLLARLSLGTPGQRRWLEARIYWPGGPGDPDRPWNKRPAPTWAAEPEGLRVGAQGIRLLAAERLQQLCRSRPRRFGGLFLDLVLLEEGWERRPAAPEESLPLRNSQGEQEGFLSLSALPPCRRQMVGCMLAQGQRLFACLEEEVSLPSAGLYCAALYWQTDQNGSKSHDDIRNIREISAP